MTFLETAFPFRDVSRLVAADRRAPDPAYQAHRWWARRPPALVRAALLSAALPPETDARNFWTKYASPMHHMEGMTVRDPFLGGGTTLVEAARLGAVAAGSDVDPLAVTISEHQLSPPSREEVTSAGGQLLSHLRARIGALWSGSTDPDGSRWQPVHYFTVASVTCPSCETTGPLYRSLVLARSLKKPGSVRRSTPLHAFCPECVTVHDLPADAKSLTCCGATFRLDLATYRRTRYECPACGERSTHEQLKTGVAPRSLVAVEEIPLSGVSGGRRIRAPRPGDWAALTKARKWAAPGGSSVPTGVALKPGAGDQRPVSFGIDTVGKLHTDRQIAYLTEAFAWIDTNADVLSIPVARALRLAVSTTITSNNRLCGYATDYGRLAPLFSVRAFSLPWLTVELNPLNASGGRGTLAAALTRVAASCDDVVRRNVLNGRRQAVATSMTLPRVRVGHSVRAQDSTASTDDVGPLADLCITDPPYFDFIPYDTLSQVFRSWVTDSRLAGTPLLPAGADAVTAFGTSLGTALASAMKQCKEDALVAFTYKGDSEAWQAVGLALDEAKLRVTALWPVLADPHMGHHSHEGNCEYDILVVARSVDSTEAGGETQDTESMIATLRKDRKVSAADVANLRSAMSMAADRRGTVRATTSAG